MKYVIYLLENEKKIHTGMMERNNRLYNEEKISLEMCTMNNLGADAVIEEINESINILKSYKNGRLTNSGAMVDK